MYVPWKPLGYNLNLYPVISGISLDEDELKLTIKEYENESLLFEMEILFQDLVGIQIVDESTFQTMKDLSYPENDDIDNENQEFSPLWKSTSNYRRDVYGVLGEALYDELYSYWIIGNTFVYLIDTQESEPIVKILSECVKEEK